MRPKGSDMNQEQSLAEAAVAQPSSATPDPLRITATKVADARRLEFLPLHFGERLMLSVEIGVYNWMSSLCASYAGGYWEYVELSNGGAYMAPTGAEDFHLRVSGNGFDGRVSPDAAGVIATTFALNALLWKGHESLREKYEQLMAFIAEHPDRRAIRDALD
jgi:Antirestriction protein